MVITQVSSPIGETEADLIQHDKALGELDPVPLAIVECDGFDTLVLRQGQREAGGGILPAGE